MLSRLLLRTSFQLRRQFATQQQSALLINLQHTIITNINRPSTSAIKETTICSIAKQQQHFNLTSRRYFATNDNTDKKTNSTTEESGQDDEAEKKRKADERQAKMKRGAKYFCYSLPLLCGGAVLYLGLFISCV